MAVRRLPPRTALPLGSHRGEDALDVWEHVLFQEYLEQRWRPRDAEWERAEARRFEEEAAWLDEAPEPPDPYWSLDADAAIFDAVEPFESDIEE